MRVVLSNAGIYVISTLSIERKRKLNALKNSYFTITCNTVPPLPLCFSSQHQMSLWGVLLGYRHTTISLICMSTHKAMAARCLSYHQAVFGQPAIRALATAPLKRLALSVLFTIATNSYQTTLYSLRENLQ